MQRNAHAVRGIVRHASAYRSMIGTKTIVNQNNSFRDLCVEFFIANPMNLGGEGGIVEINEAVLSRWKNNRGCQVKKQWISGGVERGSGKCFFVSVEKRSTDTLLAIIQERVLLGTAFMSDSWTAYSRIDKLLVRHTRLFVNHFTQFVDPDTGTCTNSVESTWQKSMNSHSIGLEHTVVRFFRTLDSSSGVPFPPATMRCAIYGSRYDLCILFGKSVSSQTQRSSSGPPLCKSFCFLSSI
ncbi:hypothetical protein AB6A40_008603 [Gnathostoma spinigerum]|uniref:ISXO2-like transposase domain-containing protein n=1 Tax=Gnathostoma spinigerum TaxID=75299 RepID=A0ABD6EUN9_9BILA